MRFLALICGLSVVASGCGPAGATPSGSLIVMVTAGPTCPVERIGDPTCAPRVVKGADLRLTGATNITLVTDANGTARATHIPAGVYRLVALPLAGLMGAPRPLQVLIRQGHVARARLTYDTGIR